MCMEWRDYMNCVEYDEKIMWHPFCVSDIDAALLIEIMSYQILQECSAIVLLLIQIVLNMF